MEEGVQRQDGDVLAGLEDVPWGTLHHAYGSADDVVHDIRALVAADVQEREAALERLHSTIWHQGTVYEGTAYAAPFLIALVDAPGTEERERAGILGLLSCMAEGHSYVDVHRRDAEREAPGFAEKLERELGWVRQAHDAVATGIPVYLRCLRDPRLGVRYAAVELLGCFSEHAVQIVPHLLALREREEEADVLRQTLASLSRLAPADPAHLAACRALDVGVQKAHALWLFEQAICSLLLRFTDHLVKIPRPSRISDSTILDWLRPTNWPWPKQRTAMAVSNALLKSSTASCLRSAWKIQIGRMGHVVMTPAQNTAGLACAPAACRSCPFQERQQ